MSISEEDSRTSSVITDSNETFSDRWQGPVSFLTVTSNLESSQSANQVQSSTIMFSYTLTLFFLATLTHLDRQSGMSTSSERA